MEEMLKAIQAATAAMTALRRASELYDVAKDTLSSDDKDQVEAALAVLQEEYDTTHNRVQAKLRG